MRGRRVDEQEVGLKERHIQTLRRATPNDEILLIDEPTSKSFTLEVTPVTILVRHIDRFLDIVPPPEHFFRPQLEGVQEMKLSSISQSHLGLAEAHEAIDRSVIIVVSRICYTTIDPVHLHLDLPAHRNIATEYLGAELPVVSRRRGVTQH